MICPTSHIGAKSIYEAIATLPKDGVSLPRIFMGTPRVGSHVTPETLFLL